MFAHRRGQLFLVYNWRLPSGSDASVYGRRLPVVLVETRDLVDADGVAELLGLAQRNSVSLYQRRYTDMPRPVIDLGPHRVKLWLRSEIETWSVAQASGGRSKPARRASTQ